MKSNYLILVILVCASFTLTGQEIKFPGLDVSPMDAAHYPNRSAFANYLDADDPDRNQMIKVLYSRPNKKDREVFGGLESWGKDWRLGANEATEVTFYTPVEIGGKYIGSGTYTMFAELYPSHWILKISTERFIAGVANRDISKDVVAISIPTSMTAEVREAFTIGFQKVDEGHVNMIFEWDRTKAVMPINLNPASMAGSDVSPMDLAQYPNSSRFRNLQDPEDLDKAVAKIRVIYSRPQMKGREIFGGLVKYGEVWRLGANQTTELTFFEDVMIGDTKIRAGKYGLFAKVNKDNWEFIVHKNVQSWGNANHDDKDNVVKITVPSESTPETVEALAIVLQEKGSEEVELVVGWENTMARLPIKLMK